MSPGPIAVGNGQPIHANAVCIEGFGIVIAGPSGSGKTALALDLIRRSRASQLAASLIGDDQLFLVSGSKGPDASVIVTGAEALAGRVEIRGHGVAPLGDEPAAPTPLALWVELAPADTIERYQMEEQITVGPVTVPFRRVPSDDRSHAVTICLSALGFPAWY